MRSLIEPLVSNGYSLEMIPERLGWLEPTGADLPVEQLREKFRQNGYLWLKGFFDRDVILDFHRFFFETIMSGTKTFTDIIASQEYTDFCTRPVSGTSTRNSWKDTPTCISARLFASPNLEKTTAQADTTT